MYEIRIYTEQKNVENTDALVRTFGNFTKYDARGFYNGTSELSVVYEFITSESLEKFIYLCEQIARRNGQESVMLTAKLVKVVFIN